MPSLNVSRIGTRHVHDGPALDRMPNRPIPATVQSSIWMTTFPDVTRMPLSPPWPLIVSPRSTTLSDTPAATVMPSSPANTLTPAYTPRRSDDRHGLRDSEDAVAAGVRRDDLAFGIGRGQRARKRAARERGAAVLAARRVPVVTMNGDECTLCRGSVRRQASGNKERGHASGDGGTRHGESSG